MHGRTFDYSRVRYQGRLKNVTIICRKHGPFSQKPVNHYWFRHGCTTCAQEATESRAVVVIKKFLKNRDITFETEARLLPNKSLRFDFYLPESRTLVEYHGQQHFRQAKGWVTKDEFKISRKRDRFKARWARRNGYTFIVIPYTCEDVVGFLTKALAGQVDPNSAMWKHRDSSKANRERERRLRNSKAYRMARQLRIPVTAYRAQVKT